MAFRFMPRHNTTSPRRERDLRSALSEQPDHRQGAERREENRAAFSNASLISFADAGVARLTRG